MACLVLNFDINKTIIMSDIGAGRDIYGTLNSLLSECVWGTYDTSIPRDRRVPSDWIPCGDSPYTYPPVTNAVTFGTFLEDHTNMVKKDRTAIKTTFTDSGCIGERYRPFLLHIQAAMRPSVDSAQSEYYHMLPSFFTLIQYLIQQKVDFRIVFRTFGVDVPSIAREFNLFCQGSHPYFPLSFPLDGTHPGFLHDLRLHLPHQTGKLIRTSEGPTGVQLAYVAPDQTVQIAQGFNEVDRVIRKEWLAVDSSDVLVAKRPPYCTVAIRDDFPWWHNVNNESCTSGKLFLINRNTDQSEVVEVFFDDNIERDRAHIVDVRDRQTFEPIPFSESVAKHFLHKVEPYDAITDKNYFVNIVKAIIEARPSLTKTSVN